MPLAAMLASFLTLLLSLPVLASSSLFLSACAAWRWLLFWGPCPLGVLGTTLVDLCSLCEDMRSMYAFAPGPSASSCLNAGPGPLWFSALFSFLVCRFPSRLAVSFVSLYRATSIERHLFFVIQNSFQYYII